VLGGSPYASGTLAGPHRRCENATRQALGDGPFAAEFARGADLTLDEAVTYALAGSSLDHEGFTAL